MTTHRLKTWPQYWRAIQDGRKTFELRQEDTRTFSVGDKLELAYYDPAKGFDSKHDLIFRTVTYIMRGPLFGLQEGWVIIGLSNL